MHFGRRLLDDTDLSILEIALAAGSGGVRQFNRASRRFSSLGELDAQYTDWRDEVLHARDHLPGLYLRSTWPLRSLG